jgi:two-component system, response regulator PdtaR
MPSQSMNAIRILVVEDDTIVGMLIAEMLESLGHAVCAVEATEAAAVTAAAHYRPDLIIADARLGDGSGVSAIEQILRTGYIPHLFMSGNISRVKAMRPDAAVLQKPFREAELTRAIQSAFDAATARERATS